ncbi:MAG: hypothetical protein QW767_01955 [Thermoprotei archaeon]
MIDVVDVAKPSVVEQAKTEEGAHTPIFDADHQILYSFYPRSCCAAALAQT